MSLSRGEGEEESDGARRDTSTPNTSSKMREDVASFKEQLERARRNVTMSEGKLYYSSREKMATCEDAQLLHAPVQSSRKNYVMRNCVNSKPAKLVLLLNLTVLMAFNSTFNTSNIMMSFVSYGAMLGVGVMICTAMFLSILAGLLSDIKYGRYKTILYTLPAMIIAFGLLPLILTAAAYAFHTLKRAINYNIIIALIVLLHAVFLLSTLVVLITNGIQFGMDQLHDCSTQDSILYVHWYVWIYYFIVAIGKLPWVLYFYDSYYLHYLDGLRIASLVIWSIVFSCTLLLLILSLYIIYCRQSWFLIEQSRTIPYKLLYRVIRFAWRHKTPVYRSAFTYCEDEIPSRLDLGKTKYGGPFTTEQVEDVRAFWGILKVLLVIGPVFILQFVLEVTLPAFSEHGVQYFRNSTSNQSKYGSTFRPEGVAQYITLSSGLLSPLLVVVCIPLYLRCVRPHITCCFQGIMRRIGYGILLMTLSLCCAFAMDMVVHSKDNEEKCMLFIYISRNSAVTNSTLGPLIYQNVYFFVAQNMLIALSNMTFDDAVFEFIASQSPYFMKGLLFGVFFAVRCLFQMTALLSMIPFSVSWKSVSLSCGSGFYLMNIGIGLIVFVVYVCVARSYKYRERDEPSNERCYVEEYYYKYPSIDELLN